MRLGARSGAPAAVSRAGPGARAEPVRDGAVSPLPQGLAVSSRPGSARPCSPGGAAGSAAPRARPAPPPGRPPGGALAGRAALRDDPDVDPDVTRQLTIAANTLLQRRSEALVQRHQRDRTSAPSEVYGVRISPRVARSQERAVRELENRNRAPVEGGPAFTG